MNIQKQPDSNLKVFTDFVFFLLMVFFTGGIWCIGLVAFVNWFFGWGY